MAPRNTTPRRWWFAPALVTDLPVLLALIACWLLATAALLHLWLIRHRLRERLRRKGSTQ